MESKMPFDYGKALEMLASARTVGVVIHIRPDGDAVGSGTALCEILSAMGKQARLYCDDTIPERLAFLGGERCAPASFGSEDVLIAADCGDLGRLGQFGTIFSRHKKTINFDHHLTNDHYATCNYVCHYASNCEQIYEFGLAAGVALTQKTALALYVGLISDTGNFMHGNTDEHCFLTAAALIKQAGNVSDAVYKMFKETPYPRFRLLAQTLSRARFFLEGKVCLLSVSQDMLADVGADSSQTEGFVDYAVNCSGVKVGICMMQSSDNCFRISLRGISGVDVSKIASTFGGGGHIAAAGCVICGFYEDAVEKLVRECKFLLDQ